MHDGVGGVRRLQPVDVEEVVNPDVGISPVVPSKVYADHHGLGRHALPLSSPGSVDDICAATDALQ